MASSDLTNLKRSVASFPSEVTMLFEAIAKERREIVRSKLETASGDEFAKLQGQALELRFWCELRRNCTVAQPDDKQE